MGWVMDGKLKSLLQWPNKLLLGVSPVRLSVEQGTGGMYKHNLVVDNSLIAFLRILKKLNQ